MAVDFAFARHVACNWMGILTPCAIQRLLQWSWLRALYRRVCCFGIPWHYVSAAFSFRRGCPLRSVAAHSCFARPT